MTLSDLAVRRPVFAAVAAIILCVVGAAAYTALPVRELPAVDPPQVSIGTTYRGASAEVVEERITQVIERQIAGIQGIDRISSVSRDGVSRINIAFTLDRKLDDAANDVRDAVSRVQARAARPGRSPDHRQGQCRLLTDPAGRAEVQDDEPAGAHGLRQPLSGRALVDDPRRGSGRCRRWAELRDAHLAGRRRHGRPRRHRRRRRQRPQQPESRAAGRYVGIARQGLHRPRSAPVRPARGLRPAAGADPPARPRRRPPQPPPPR